MGADMIRVGIVEDHPLYRQGLVQVIESAPDLDLVATAASIAEMEAIGFADVEVVLLDLHLPDCHGAEAVGRVKAKTDSILVISASEDRGNVVNAIAAGVCGYLTKSSESEEIAKAIAIVASGGTYVSPTLAAYLLGNARESERSNAFALTAREREILSLLADGETDVNIAERLFISVTTVRSHLDRIRDKTGRRRRGQLARLAFEPEAEVDT